MEPSWKAPKRTCSDDLALIRVVGSGFEDGVGKQAGTALEGGEVPDDAGAVC